MWQYALWGLVGAAANMGVVFVEASRRVNGWPWRRPKGPGGGVYAASVVIQLGIAGATTSALATTSILTQSVVAFGVGAAAPVVVKKLASYAEALLPSGDAGKDRDGEHSDEA